MVWFIPLAIIVFLFWGCADKKELNESKFQDLPTSDLPGVALAKTHCSGCHSFVDPKVLPKSIWKDQVLPYMGYRLGIFEGDQPPDSLFGLSFGDSILGKASIPEKPVLAKADWIKIVEY
jgi:hypothetical protein